MTEPVSVMHRQAGLVDLAEVRHVIAERLDGDERAADDVLMALTGHGFLLYRVTP